MPSTAGRITGAYVGYSVIVGTCPVDESGTRCSISAVPGRYDQDLRFGSAMPKQAFFLVKFLEDVGYDGPRHFDAHAYRSEDAEGVKEFARGCMRTYLILKEKARQWNEDAEIQAIMAKLAEDGNGAPSLEKYTPEGQKALAAHAFDRAEIASRGLDYERLDQLTMDILFGVR